MKTQLFALLLAFGLCGAEDVEETCGTRSYGLKIDGQNCGSFDVHDDQAGFLQIDIDITECDLAGADSLVDTYITELRYQTCCKGVPSSCSAIMLQRFDDADFSPQVTLSGVMEPDCDEGVAADIHVWVDVESPGGVQAFNDIFPPEGRDVKFSVSLDAGSTGGTDSYGSSYFDATFVAPDTPLDGKTFDGYCVDAGNFISTGTVYNAKAYSFLELDLSGQVGNIDRPQYLDRVAWCINNWIPGTEYSASGLTPSDYTLSSGTLQKAIWLIVDDESSGGGLGSVNDAWATYIKNDCMTKGMNFIPGCNDKVPVIVIPEHPFASAIPVQNQYVQTTFAQLNIDCHGETASGSAEAYCVTGGGGESGGDPHFKTFGNEWFDFHGGCDLVLASFPNFAHGLGLTAHIRTTTRYLYSFIESAAIQIGDDILEVSSFGQYLMDGVSGATMPATLGGFPVEFTQLHHYLYRFVIDLGNSRDITIKTYKDLVYVSLNVRHGNSPEFFDATGILGSWTNGTRFARDAATVISDDNEYGQEWQVRDTDAKLFASERAPQWPATCEMPNLEERTSRRLGANAISVEDATSACSHIKKKHEHEMCVFDVIATNDVTLAQGAAY